MRSQVSCLDYKYEFNLKSQEIVLLSNIYCKVKII